MRWGVGGILHKVIAGDSSLQSTERMRPAGCLPPSSPASIPGVLRDQSSDPLGRTPTDRRTKHHTNITITTSGPETCLKEYRSLLL